MFILIDKTYYNDNEGNNSNSNETVRITKAAGSDSETSEPCY